MSTTATQSTAGLSDDTLDKLRELRRLNVDSAKGFQESAELVKDHGIKQAFLEFAEQREQQAEELAKHVAWNDGAEEERGSYAAAMHRTWLNVREACSSDTVQTALIEAERGEDAIKEAYEKALEEVKDAPIHDLIASQYDQVKTVHDRVRDLREIKKD